MNGIEEVRKVLDELGWVKGRLYGEGGGVCLLGAATECARRGLLQKRDCEAAAGKISAHAESLFPDRIPNDSYLLPAAAFNDHPDTTREDVNLVLKHAEADET